MTLTPKPAAGASHVTAGSAGAESPGDRGRAGTDRPVPDEAGQRLGDTVTMSNPRASKGEREAFQQAVLEAHDAGKHNPPHSGCPRCMDYETKQDEEGREVRVRESRVNLTLDILTTGGVPQDITASTIATLASRAVADYLSRRGVSTNVKSRVSSAFIIRVEQGEGQS